MRRHLPAAGVGVVFRADRAQQHLERRHAEHEAQGTVAVIRIEPVVRRFQVQASSNQYGLVSGTADLKEDQALVFELDFLVIEFPRQQHGAVRTQQIVARQAEEIRGTLLVRALAVADRCLHSLNYIALL
jgi:hypothetical protein